MYRCHYRSRMCRVFVRLPDRRITTGVNNGVEETTDGSGSFQETTLFDKHSHRSQVMDPLVLHSEIQTDKDRFQQLASCDLPAHIDATLACTHARTHAVSERAQQPYDLSRIPFFLPPRWLRLSTGLTSSRSVTLLRSCCHLCFCCFYFMSLVM